MKNQKIFLGILKSFLHPDEKLPSTRRLTEEEWKEMLDAACAHAVLPVVYEVAWKSQAFQNLPEQERMRYKQQAMRMIVVQVQRTESFLKLYQKMLDEGITPLVLKGLICRNMYRLSDYRVSGDEDLLVKEEEFHMLDQLLLKEGFQRQIIEDYEKTHEITYMNQLSGMHLEVHLSLFSEQSGAYGRLNEEFKDVFERQAVYTIKGTKVHTLDETQHMLYLLCHGLKHFLHSGFGIRQLCDMILFAETYGGAIDWNEIRESTKRQSMYEFWMNLFDIGEQYLGFSWKKAMLERPDKKILDSEPLLEDILDAGVFGKATDERLHSANITLQAADISEGKKSGIRASLFPEIEYMKQRYPYLNRWRILLPVAWVQRVFAYQKRSGAAGLKRAAQKGKERVVLLEKYSIIVKK